MGYSGPFPYEVPQGGTGQDTFVANQVLVGGASATGPLQQVAAGTSGQLLTSAGAGLPIWTTVSGVGAFTSINVQTFTTSGTYTPTAGMVYCLIQLVGGGGGSAGVPASSSQSLYNAGGGGGGYAAGYFSAATIGASQVVTVGTGGTGTLTSPAGNGNTSSVGALISATGGGGASYQTVPTGTLVFPGTGGVGTGGYYQQNGQNGDYERSATTSNGGRYSGAGGDSALGFGGPPVAFNTSSAVNFDGDANSPTGGYGGGASGAAESISASSQVASNGADGAAGIVLITEYIS